MRDFRVDVQRQQGADIRQQAVDACRRQQARRAAADEDRVDRAGPRSAARRRSRSARSASTILLLGKPEASPTALHFVRIEVAIRALAHAPGEVHVQRQRRQRFADSGCPAAGRHWQPARRRQPGSGAARRSGRRGGRGGRRLAVRADRLDGDHRSFSASSRKAWPRCDRRFFSSADSSAAVLPSAGKRKYGS